MAEKTYRYGVIFWNEKTDEEIFAWLEATNYFDAEDEIEKYSIEGYVRGVPTFVEEKMIPYYDKPIETVAKKSE